MAKYKTTGKSSWGYKVLDGQNIKPAFYDGGRLGHGKYFAAQIENGELLRLSCGKPRSYRSV